MSRKYSHLDERSYFSAVDSNRVAEVLLAEHVAHRPSGGYCGRRIRGAARMAVEGCAVIGTSARSTCRGWQTNYPEENA